MDGANFLKATRIAIPLALGFGAPLFAAAHSGFQAESGLTYNGQKPTPLVAIGEAHYLDPDGLTEWGWTVQELGSREQISFAHQKATLSVLVDKGRRFISLADLSKWFDCGLSAPDAQGTVTLLPRVRVIEYVSRRLTIDASLPVTYTSTFNKNKGRMELTIPLSVLSPDVVTDLGPGVTIATTTDNSVQIIVDNALCDANPSSAPLDELFCDLSQPIQVADSQQQLGSLNATVSQSAEWSHLAIALPHGPAGLPLVKLSDPQTLEVIFPGLATSKLDLPESYGGCPIQSLKSRVVGSSTVVDIQLMNPSGLIASFSGNKFELGFLKPLAHPEGVLPPLQGKLIVVDPGHGGKDTGATNPWNGAQEKNLTLAISKKLAANLVMAGAIVVMNRVDDTFVSLEGRAHEANADGADLFLCVHINSNGGDTQSSGSITFFHGQNPTSRKLAESIEAKLSVSTSIPGIGVWSDTKIYRSGFSVLRNTKMPGVLMELGFIKNKSDVDVLQKDAAQEAMAQSIVAGVEDFLEAN